MQSSHHILDHFPTHSRYYCGSMSPHHTRHLKVACTSLHSPPLYLVSQESIDGELVLIVTALHVLATLQGVHKHNS